MAAHSTGTPNDCTTHPFYSAPLLQHVLAPPPTTALHAHIAPLPHTAALCHPRLTFSSPRCAALPCSLEQKQKAEARGQKGSSDILAAVVAGVMGEQWSGGLLGAAAQLLKGCMQPVGQQLYRSALRSVSATSQLPIF